MPTKTDVLASAAVTLSVVATLSCIIMVPVLFQKGATLRDGLSVKMGKFREMTDETWTSMMHIRNKNGLDTRATRQAGGGCACAESKCCW